MPEAGNGRAAGAHPDLARYRALRDVELPLHAGALCVVDGPVDVAALERRVAERAGAVAIALHYGGDAGATPIGSDTERLRLPAPRVDRASVAPPGGDADIGAAVAEAWSRKLAPGRPWQVTVIDGLARGRTAILVKAHRSLCDDGGGPRLAELLLADATPALPPATARRPPRAVAPRGDRAVTPAQAIASMLASASRPLLERTRAAGRTLAELLEPGVALHRARDLARWLESTSLVVATPAPETPFNGMLGGARRLGFVRLARDVVAGIEEAYGATPEAIVLAILGDALGRYLRSRGRVTVALELIARVDPAAAPGAAAASPTGALLALPVGSLAVHERLDAIRGALRDPAAHERRASFESVLGLCLALPAGARSVAAALAYQAVNTVCARARPPHDLELAGRRVLLVAPIPALPWNVGLGFAWLDGAGDELVIGIHADTQLAPDIEAIEECLRAAYVEAAASAGVPAIDPERRMRAPSTAPRDASSG